MCCLSDASVAREIRPFFFHSVTAKDLCDLCCRHNDPPRLEPSGHRGRIGLRVCVMDDIEEHLDDHGDGREEHRRRPGLQHLPPFRLLRVCDRFLDADVEEEAFELDASDVLALGELTQRIVDPEPQPLPQLRVRPPRRCMLNKLDDRCP